MNMKNTMKRMLNLALAAAMALSLTACGGSDIGSASGKTDGSAGPVVVKLATTVNEQDSFHLAAEKFAELVKERTNGAYEVEIYPNGALGDERTLLESMQMGTGTLDMAIVTSGPFVNFVPEMGVLDMPFLFPDNESAYKVLDGEIGKELLGKLENANLKGLAYAERGFRNLTNSVHPITCAADCKDLKIRVMENEVYTATFKALGVNAVPMAWSDTLTALQQNTIQGQENPVNVIHAFRLWESQKYVTMTRHAYASAIFTASLDFFKKLPEDVQTVFTESAQEAAEYERQWVAENETTQKQALLDNGMEIVEEPDLASFQEAVQSVYDQYPQYADYLARIKAELA